MRIIVISDTHGVSHRLERVLQKHCKDADLFLHLGDGASEWETVSKKYPDLCMKIVVGNCDFNFTHLPAELLLKEEGYTVFATHGNLYQVKFGLDKIIQRARESHASILLYGHTHQSFTDYRDGIYIFNPGSLSRPQSGIPSYGILDLTEAGIVCNVVEEKRL